MADEPARATALRQQACPLYRRALRDAVPQRASAPRRCDVHEARSSRHHDVVCIGKRFELGRPRQDGCLQPYCVVDIEPWVEDRRAAAACVMSVSSASGLLLLLRALRCASERFHVRDRLLIGLSSSSGLLAADDIIQAVRAGGARCSAGSPSVISCYEARDNPA